MRQIILFLSILILFSCNKTKKNDIDINKYIGIKFKTRTKDKKEKVYAYAFFVNNNDSISNTVNKYERRFNYLLMNKINRDSLNSISLVDTIFAETFFRNEINSKRFKDNFISLLNFKNKKKYSEDDLMLVASKFFYMQKIKENYGVKICIGANGSKELDKAKGYTLLETVVFDAIFENIIKKDSSFNFMSKLKSDFFTNYVKNTIKNINSTKNTDTLIIVRNSVYKLMKNDTILKKYLLKYIKENKNNIPIQIKK